jgi:UDP-glucuronate 4-epimerase
LNNLGLRVSYGINFTLRDLDETHIGVKLRILITGAAGFIGSSVASSLRSQGHSVVGVDSLSPYYSVELKNFRKKVLLDSSGVEFRSLDLSDSALVDELFTENNFDSVIHLAAQPGVRVPFERWSWYKRDNVEGFSNILLAAAKSQVNNFLYASSSSVYGNGHQGQPLNEKKTAAVPVSFYGATKLANEVLAEACSRQTKMKTRGLRFFTVYGPWGRPDMVYFRMVSSALNKVPFNFFGEGNVSRDFTFIDDVTSAVSDLHEELNSQTSNFSDVVNVGGGRPISINNCLSILEELLDCEIPFKRVSADNRDVDSTNADFTYLKSLIGTFPTTRPKEGFERFVDWARNPQIKGNLEAWVKSVD